MTGEGTVGPETGPEPAGPEPGGRAPAVEDSTEVAYRSVLLGLAGAVAALGTDAGVAAHYGEPLVEQRSLVQSAGLVDRSNRGLVSVSGADRLPWLHSLLSQHVSGLEPGAGTEALLLDPQGHVEFHLGLSDDGTTTWLDTEPGLAPALSTFLERMRFLMRVEVSDVSDQWAQLALAGARAPQVLADFSADVSPVPAVVRARRWPTTSYDVRVPRADLDRVAARFVAAGALPAGMEAWEALRVFSREARQGLETDGRTVPHELGWVASAVHLDKGCYRGQETVARVHAMGRAPRRLVLLHLDGTTEELPVPGAAVLWDDRVVGFVGTAARHFELGPVCLAVVKRSVPTGAVLTAELGEGNRTAASIDPDSELSALPGAGAGRRAQQGLRNPAVE